MSNFKLIYSPLKENLTGLHDLYYKACKYENFVPLEHFMDNIDFEKLYIYSEEMLETLLLFSLILHRRKAAFIFSRYVKNIDCKNSTIRITPTLLISGYYLNNIK